MDYFQSIVEQYLQADRANLISTEFFLQHKDKENDPGPPNWYIDILNVNMREQRVYLCEITYARKLHELIKNCALGPRTRRRSVRRSSGHTSRKNGPFAFGCSCRKAPFRNFSPSFPILIPLHASHHSR